jgi:hypothetical protein
MSNNRADWPRCVSETDRGQERSTDFPKLHVRNVPAPVAGAQVILHLGADGRGQVCLVKVPKERVAVSANADERLPLRAEGQVRDVLLMICKDRQGFLRMHQGTEVDPIVCGGGDEVAAGCGRQRGNDAVLTGQSRDRLTVSQDAPTAGISVEEVWTGYRRQNVKNLDTAFLVADRDPSTVGA